MRRLSPSGSGPSVTFRLRMPLEMRRFLDRQRVDASSYVRKLIEREMGRAK